MKLEVREEALESLRCCVDAGEACRAIRRIAKDNGQDPKSWPHWRLSFEGDEGSLLWLTASKMRYQAFLALADLAFNLQWDFFASSCREQLKAQFLDALGTIHTFQSLETDIKVQEIRNFISLSVLTYIRRLPSEGRSEDVEELKRSSQVARDVVASLEGSLGIALSKDEGEELRGFEARLRRPAARI